MIENQSRGTEVEGQDHDLIEGPEQVRPVVLRHGVNFTAAIPTMIRCPAWRDT